MTDESATGADWPGFEAALRSYDRDLRAFAGRLLSGSGVAVDDVLQDAYLEAFRASTGGKPSPEPHGRAYMFRLVHWRALDALRSHQHRAGQTVEQEPAFELVDHHASTVEQHEGREDVAGALAALSVEARAILLLVDGAGFSYAEAGELLDIPEGTVASRLHNARSRFRLEITKGMKQTNA